MEFDNIRNVSLPFIKVYTFESSYCSLRTLLIFLVLTNAIKWSLHNSHYQPCEAQILSLGSGCYIFTDHFSNSRFIVCEIAPVPQWMRFLFWCHSFISPLGQQTLSSWECAHTHTYSTHNAHPLSFITLFALSRSPERTPSALSACLCERGTEVGKYSTPTQWLA